jgi:hypothetical protein
MAGRDKGGNNEYAKMGIIYGLYNPFCPQMQVFIGIY